MSSRVALWSERIALVLQALFTVATGLSEIESAREDQKRRDEESGNTQADGDSGQTT